MFAMSSVVGKELRGIGQKRSLSVGGGLGPMRHSGTRIAKKQHVAAALPKILALGTEEAEPQPLPSVYKRESTLDKRCKKKLNFAEGTKTWQGLRPDRHFLDDLIFQFFVLGKQFSSVDVIKVIGFDSSLIEGVNVLMIDLCNRIQEAVAVDGDGEDVGVPVLLHGGGRSMRVGSFHLEYLVSLQKVVAEAAKVVSLQFGLESSRLGQPTPTDTSMERSSQTVAA
mmetsp:Transcript_18755/g.33275  ORF Transcript_18755/g.33275 Transcript_18755/m.33275 type:complete len:225 (-) Transcript_18755:769-1443(-)